jgi:hypothetical protein
MAASTTDTIDTTKPISHPWEVLRGHDRGDHHPDPSASRPTT